MTEVASEQLGLTGQRAKSQIQCFSAWVLVPSDDLETLDLRAHCENFLQTALITTRPGIVEKTVQAVVSVFVQVEKRSSGPELSIRYRPKFLQQVRMDVADEIADVKLLRDADIDALPEHDTILLREELCHCDKPAITIVPDAAKFRWMIQRADYYTAPLDYPPIEIVGAHVKGTNIFYHDFVDRVTVCIRFRSDSVDATRKLVRAGKKQAARYGLGLGSETRCAWGGGIEIIQYHH
ncbi:hypothetical protein BC937DRAFT_88785 [Endogone sp. FLAS-F59071]|nr:hypothetical protein BC937DRAFT_88785 [Endogone sp. FLAS-F59071]|eukprot:RUS18424.1 hypothetical protein BC937DRAFT_88785 [Endogone sp. FLAS-F59071]